MAQQPKRNPRKKTKTTKQPKRTFRAVRRGVFHALVVVFAVFAVLTLIYAVLNPPTTPYMFAEARREAGVEYEWVDLEDVAPVMARSAVAAEDANFCLHWGLDLQAIRAALDAGGNRGGSTISQQVIKNVYLWQGRSWMRKSLEALWTPMSEVIWSKRRILELYLNVAEFDRGVFGVQAAARHYFDRDAADLTAVQAARLAAVLPNPKGRNAANPSDYTRRRAASIRDGAATIAADGRAACFERHIAP